MSATGFKQTLPSPYYITTGTGVVGLVNSGTVDAPSFGAATTTQIPTNAATILAAAGTILRDQGQSVRSANRVFRKVQLLVSTGSVLVGGSDGVAGSSPNYISCYVELPSGALFTGLPKIARLG